MAQSPFPNGHAPGQHDLVIALMGMTGAGKSSFISLLLERAIKVGHELESCTQDVETYSFIYEGPPQRRIFLVDTPGFDDDRRTDSEILRILTAWLAAASETSKIQLSGIIYLHRINQPRLQGSAKKNIRQFEKLCGEQALQKVILATTMWDVEDNESAVQREKQLLETREFWGYMIEKGSKAYRHFNSKESAMALIKHFVKDDSKMALSVLEQASEAAVMEHIEKRLAQERIKLHKTINFVKNEFIEALQQKDQEVAEVIAEVRREQAMQVDQLRKQNESLQEGLAKTMEKLQEVFRLLETRVTDQSDNTSESVTSASNLQSGAFGASGPAAPEAWMPDLSSVGPFTTPFGTGVSSSSTTTTTSGRHVSTPSISERSVRPGPQRFSTFGDVPSSMSPAQTSASGEAPVSPSTLNNAGLSGITPDQSYAMTQSSTYGRGTNSALSSGEHTTTPYQGLGFTAMPDGVTPQADTLSLSGVPHGVPQPTALTSAPAVPASQPTLALERQIKHKNWLTALSFSPDGHRLATASSNIVSIFNLSTGKAEQTLKNAEPVRSLAFSPDGARIAWTVDSNSVGSPGPGGGPGSCAAFDVFFLGPPAQREYRRVWETRLPALAFSPDGARLALATAAGEVLLWSITQHVIEHRLGALRPAGVGPASATAAAAAAVAVTFSPDGTRLAVASGNRVAVWRVDTALPGLETVLGQHAAQILCVALSPSGAHLAAGHIDGAVWLWDLCSGGGVPERSLLHAGAVQAVAWAPDGSRLAVAPSDRTVRVWATPAGGQWDVAQTLACDGKVVCLAFSMDGYRFAAGSQEDMRVKVWRTASTTT